MVGNSKRVRGGIQAKANGAAFESIFVKMCQLGGAAVTRIPDSCKRVSPKRLIQVKSPWDFVVTLNSKTALIDTKTTQGAVFTSAMCSPHQIRELASHNRLGAIAGYVVWLRQINAVYFLPAHILVNLLDVGGSIHPPYVLEAKYLGAINFEIWKLFA